MTTIERPTPTFGSPALHLRAAEESDAPDVARLLATPEDLRQVSPTEMFPIDARTVRHWIRERRAGYVLEERGRVVAYAELVEDASGADRLWIGHMMVDPQRRGLGLGKRLVRGLLQIADTQRQAREVAISAFADNPRALRCYRSCGFLDRGHVRAHERDLVELRYPVPSRQPVVSLAATAGAMAIAAVVAVVAALLARIPFDLVVAIPLCSTVVLGTWGLHRFLPPRRAPRRIRVLRATLLPLAVGGATFTVAVFLEWLRDVSFGALALAILLGSVVGALLMWMAGARTTYETSAPS